MTTNMKDTRHQLAGRGFSAEIIASEHNQRLQVLSYDGENLAELVAALRERAAEHGYSKVFLKARAGDKESLEAAGMVAEASISGYFSGADASVLSLFLDDDRRGRPYQKEQAAILVSINERPADPSLPALPAGYKMRVAEPADSDELAALYGTVFASYPYPITEPDYLEQTMRTHVVYRLVHNGEGELVAAASAETSPKHHNAEMTDFATLPSQRGLGLAQHILAALEDDMAERRIPNLYTVARARSAGMNRVFANRGYRWTGTLVNNCHISGQFEDMHVWCKTLSQ